MKNQKGSGRRGGARRPKPESNFVPKKKSSGRKLSQKGPSDNPTPVKKGKHKPSYSKKRRPAPKPQQLADSNAPMRLNRFVAQAGICSRREADVLIAAGVVSVNGEVVTEMDHRVSQSDKVQVEGGTIKAEAKRCVLLIKTKRFLATAEGHGGGRAVVVGTASAGVVDEGGERDRRLVPAPLHAVIANAWMHTGVIRRTV